MDLVFRKATLNDIDTLVKTRIQVLRAANKLGDSTDMSIVERQSRDYYMEALKSDTHVAYLISDGNSLVGTGGISFYRVMPTYHNPTGQKAYIMNMYTAPEYRRKGIAYKALDLLISAAKERGVLQISLEATDMGKPLYEKYGFVPMRNEMKLV